jgi:hypothetical protein
MLKRAAPFSPFWARCQLCSGPTARKSFDSLGETGAPTVPAEEMISESFRPWPVAAQTIRLPSRMEAAENCGICLSRTMLQSS